MKYKAILLDLDNTLYSYDSPHQFSLKATLNFLVKHFDITFESIEEKFFKARKEVASKIPLTASSHNRLLYFQKLCEIIDIKSSNYALKLYNIYWDNFLEKMKLNDGVLSFLKRCKKNKIKISLVTDLTAHIQYRKIDRLKISNYIDFITTSEEVGNDKPNKKMFLDTLKKLDLSSSKVCMVGDSYDKDILGSNLLKIDSYWMNESKKIASQKNITKFSTFTELERLIFKIL